MDLGLWLRGRKSVECSCDQRGRLLLGQTQQRSGMHRKVCTVVDHFVRNQLGSFSTKVCSLEGYSKILRLSRWFFAISTCCRKSLNSLRPRASLLPILGQLTSLFSKLVAIIVGRPKRDFSFFLASLYAIFGLALTMYCSCSTTFFAFPSKC